MGSNSEKFILWLREVTGLTQNEIAEKLGVSASLISKIAKGERGTSVEFLKKVAAKFQLPLETVYEKAGLLDERDEYSYYNPFLLERNTLKSYEPAVLYSKSYNEELDYPRKIKELEEKLYKLRNPRYALEYSLQGKLPLKVIEKLIKIVELEIRYHEE